MPTPTPTLNPNVNYGYPPNWTAKDDFLRFPRPNGEPPYFEIRSNDDGGGYIEITSQSFYLGTMSPGDCGWGFCGYASVLNYDNVVNGVPTSGYGADFGYYYIHYLNFYSNLATITIISNPQDDAENAGESCPLGGKSIGQPVNVSNGNMWLKQKDYSLPGFGEEIEINRFYNSILQTSGLFGTGWRTKYDESLEFYGDHLVRLNMPDGRAVYLTRRLTTDAYMPFSAAFYGFIVQNNDGTYALTFKDGRKHLFGSSGKLQWQKDRQGNQTTLNYDTNNQLTGVTDAVGRTLSIVTSNGLVQSLSDSLGAVATYTYFPGTTQLSEVVYPDGSKFKFEYDTTSVSGKVFLKTVRDVNDKILETHEYDAQGRATTSEKEGGVEKYIFDYSTWINPNPYWSYNPYTLVKYKKNASDPNFVETKYFFDKNNGTNYIWRIEGNCGCGGGSEVTNFEYDDRLHLKKKTDALGNQTSYTYNYQGDILTMTDTLGTVTYTRDQYGQVLTTTDRMGGVWTNTYDTNGNLLTTTDALNKTATLTYTTLGQLATVKDARNKTTTLTYDSSGLLTQITDANNKDTNYGYDARARVTSVTNALNETTNFEYDLNNRLKKIIYPDTKFIEHTYDTAGRRTKTKDVRGSETTFGYDDAYRVTSITDALDHTKTFGYDLMSNRTSQIDASGNTTSYEYDGFNRLKKIVYPPASTGTAGLEESTTYDTVGNVKTRTDTAGRTTFYDYDTAHRLIKTTDPLNKITQFEYNNRSQMTKVRDALNQEYVFSYDALGRQLAQTRAGATMSYEYDAVGNRTKRTDYAGRVTDYVYDNLNRLSQMTYDTTTPTVSTYTYDDVSRLKTATNGAGTVTFNYDNRHRPTSTIDVFGHTVAYEYEQTATVNQKRLKFDGAMYSTYNFDDADRLTNIVDANDSTTISFGFDNADRLISKALPNGINTTYEYDGMSRLKRLKDANSTTTFFDRQYDYDPASQISRIIEPANTRTFGYDSVNRLTSVTATNNQNESYNYDAVGNRTNSHLSASYAYQSGQFNRLVSTAAASYTYDADGNMQTKTEGANVWQYSWDHENRMISATKGSQTVLYTYDALGRRVQRVLPATGENTKFIYDGQDVLVDDDNGVLTKYQNGPGIDNKLKMYRSGAARYFIADHLGSTNGWATPGGGLSASTAAYDGFGNVVTNLPTRYRYTGREYDNFTGLYYYRARWYDSQIGRFISEDPIGFAGGDVNLYGYVKNQPINRIDPLGLDDADIAFLCTGQNSINCLLSAS